VMVRAHGKAQAKKKKESRTGIPLFLLRTETAFLLDLSVRVSDLQPVYG